jgi:alpha-glucosidase
MFLEFPDQKDFASSDTEFMFGPDLLVAPKVNEFVGAYDVKFPGGIWYDFWSGQRVTGNTVSVDPSLDSVPVYVRGGTVLPEQPLIQNTAEVPQGPLRLVVYPGPACEGSLYQDDGNTLNYTRGQFLRMQFHCDVRPGRFEFGASTRATSYPAWWKTIEIVFFGTERSPRDVEVNGSLSHDWRYDATTKTVTVRSAAATSLQVVVTN